MPVFSATEMTRPPGPRLAATGRSPEATGRLLEDDGAAAVPQHAVLVVPAHRAGEGDPLGVTANRREVFRAAGVVHPGDFLLDDRALVEVRGDVVRGRADQLHAVRVGLVVWPRSLEAGQERVVDVDDPALHLGAQLRGQDAHVAG